VPSFKSIQFLSFQIKGIVLFFNEPGAILKARPSDPIEGRRWEGNCNESNAILREYDHSAAHTNFVFTAKYASRFAGGVGRAAAPRPPCGGTTGGKKGAFFQHTLSSRLYSETHADKNPQNIGAGY
jgi:hypothetical protein